MSARRDAHQLDNGRPGIALDRIAATASSAQDQEDFGISLGFRGDAYETFTTSFWAMFLSDAGRKDAESPWRKHGISNLWFPFPKQTLRRLLTDVKAEEEFDKGQKSLLSDCWPSRATPDESVHLALEDGDELMKTDGILGEGGCGIVERVILTTNNNSRVCVRKRIGRSKHLKAQKKLFEAFAREVNIMRQVKHHHCVQLVGSFTDYDSVAILSLPVADMDLAAFLDLPNLSDAQLDTIGRGFGCLCSALNYLHQKKIRHEDLKPQNVLLHGNNILLTDFGFSLDFSDDCISTTTGRPSAWTARYAAPEVMNFEPRSRATDIYSLGCILVEMLSRLYGYRLSRLKTFWKQNGNGHNSFSLNEEATYAWSAHLLQQIRFSGQLKHSRLLLFTNMLLDSNRLLRPSAQSVVDQIANFELLYPAYRSMTKTCCRAEIYKYRIDGRIDLFPRLAGLFQPAFSDNHSFILVDMDLEVIATKELGPIYSPMFGELSYWFGDQELGSLSKIQTACHNLVKMASPDVKIEARGESTVRQHPTGVLHAMLSSKIISIGQMIYDRVHSMIRLPDNLWAHRFLQVALVPVLFPKSECHGLYHFMISFDLGEDLLSSMEFIFERGVERRNLSIRDLELANA